MATMRKHSSELGERAVRMVFESGRPIAHVARDLGSRPAASFVTGLLTHI